MPAPVWVLLAIAVLLGAGTCLAAVWRRKGTSPAERVRAFWRWLLGHTFEAAATGALCLIFSLLVKELIVGAEPVRLTTFVVLFLVTALCTQVGPSLIGRIKKLGPLELFEPGSDLMSSLNDAFAKLGRLQYQDGQYQDGETFQPTGQEMSPSDRFAYDQLYLRLSTVESGGKDLPEGEKRRYCEILRVAGSIALLLPGASLQAVALFERLRKASEGRYKALDVTSYLGLACLVASTGEEGKTRRRYLERAAGCFHEVVAAAPDDYVALWRLAHVQFQLESYGSAATYNKLALQVRPGFALAKYNLGISYLKATRWNRAVRALRSISPQDEQFNRVVSAAAHDKDLDALRDDPRFDEIAAKWWPNGYAEEWFTEVIRRRGDPSGQRPAR
ncbi:MAG TPA: hypothetical protein VOA80_09030 [Thermoanaerobaculia bacterium]|nr:hypothetical protein [Thermoanaerobaculia bacterium]